MNSKEIRDYYSQDKVQEALINMAKNREVVGVFKNGSYDSRPNTLVYPQDISAMAKGGVVEFHSSVERWSNPMSLKQDNYESLRTGWDVVIDLDLEHDKITLEDAKITAKAFVWGLEKHKIKNFMLKFSGSKGFHIIIPWESIPQEINYEKTVKSFPDLPRAIMNYLKNFVMSEAERLLLKKYSPEELAEKTNKPLGKILSADGLKIEEVKPIFVLADSVLISPRHLFRMPYSIHRSTSLVSLPIAADELDDFKKEDARPDKIKVKSHFLTGSENEAELLVLEAKDWQSKREKIKKKSYREPVSFKIRIPENRFPPCIKNILVGLEDGKKRSLFILLNTLHTFKWSWSEIEDFVIKWNQKNKPPLGDNYIRSQLRWHRNKKILPPSCSKDGWYINMGICTPDKLCGGLKRTVKNPVNYARILGKRSG